MVKFDPRNKLAVAHMVLFRLAHDKFVDGVSMGNALKEMDDFIAFLNRTRSAPSVADEIIELLQPGRRIIEIHLNNESSIKEMIEVALSDFDKAIGMIGEILSHGKDSSFAA